MMPSYFWILQKEGTEMKKAVSILLVLAMVFSLCACGKSKAATECENMIAALGEVDVDSGAAIETAEKAYAALTKDEQNSISESAAVLADARSAYTFEVSKAAYQNIKSAYDIIHKFGSDLYEAWYLVSYQSQKLMNSNTVKVLASEVQYLSEEELQMGLAFVLAKNKYGEDWYSLSDAEKDSYIEMAGNYAGDDFFNQTNCLFITTWTVIRAFELNGKTAEAQEYLDSAKTYMRELSEKYSDYEYYPDLKGFFTMAGSYLDVCCDSGLSFTQFQDVKNEYEKEARDYTNDLDYIFGE